MPEETPEEPAPVAPVKSPVALVELGPVGNETKDKLTEAEAEGDVTDAFTPETADAVKEIVGENPTVHEMAGIEITEDALSENGRFVTIEFATEYKAGEPVACVLVMVHGEEISENVLQAEVPQDYFVKVFIPLDVLEQMTTADECFMVIVNSADAGSRIDNIDLAAANDAIVIALCSADGIAKDNDERMEHCHNMLERGMGLGMESTDLWFDPLFLVVKGMQDKQMDVLNAIKMFADEGLKSTGGLSNNSNGAPKEVRPIMDSTLVAMCMMQGLTSAIINPNDRRTMETIRTCDIFKNYELYSDSYLDF